MQTQTSIDPATGDILGDYPVHDAASVQTMIAAAQAAYLSWKDTPFTQRADYLRSVAAILTAKKEIFARTISQEMGKPLKEALAEVEKCAGCAIYFADNGAAFLADRPVATEYHKSYVAFRPLGIILGVMPWNFPFWQVFRFALPTLMAGNVGLLKHASNTPACALAIESVFREAGLPPHTFQALLIPASRTHEVITHPLVRAVTLTGSTPAGSAVAALAGQHVKKTVLELGGSDPYLILEDADIEQAIKVCAASRLLNCGQSCVSAKRFIIVGAGKERFEQGITAIFRQQVLGHGLDAATTVGPMSRADLRDQLHEQVQRSIAQGARLLLGGIKPEGKGAFYPLTILTDVTKAMAAYNEEMFGPVAVIIPAKDEAEAIAIANDTEFGLAGAVFTTDKERGERIAREQIESGACFVNMQVRSDVRLPFGGIKASGYGRELAAFGIHEFVNIKTIVVV